MGGSSKKKTEKIKASDLKGLKDLRGVSKMLESLRGVGTERDRAGNRKLHMNEYCLLHLRMN